MPCRRSASAARQVDYGCNLDAQTGKGWTPLSYSRAKGKYGLCHEKGIYAEDVLKARPRFVAASSLVVRPAAAARGRPSGGAVAAV